MPMSPSRAELFLVDPNEFVALRTELVRELRARGEKEEAAAVKALRRPTVAVWALNKVAHARSDLVQQVVTTAEQARAAQQALLEGNDADDFRAALARRRDAMSAVSDAADDVVATSGRARDTYTREIEKTLNVVVGSSGLCAALGRGELGDVGSGADDSEEMFAGLTPLPDDRPARAPKPAKERRLKAVPAESEPEPKRRAPSARLVRAREQLDQQRTELSQAEQAVHEAERAVAAAEEALTKTKRDLDRTREHEERLRTKVEQSEQLVERLGS
jgi:hypothetical protein